MTRSSHRVGGWIIACLALAVAVPGVAQAQSAKPAVSTGDVADLTAQSATLLGKVNASGARTTYYFQYGPTTRYGAVTPSGVATANAGTLNVTGPLGALAPFTTYHYRLVATNRNGTTRGKDRTFKTKRQPLGLALAATPNPVGFGQPTVLAGTLSGTGNANRQILLLSNPFPYIQGFAPTANVQLTNAAGQFAFPLLSVPLNTQYRVVIPGSPQIASPIVSVGVAVRVATNTSRTRVRTGRVVRFFGTVRPAPRGLADRRGRHHARIARRRVALHEARADPARRPVPRVRLDRRRQLRLQRRADGADQPDLLSLDTSRWTASPTASRLRCATAPRLSCSESRCG
jgi:hypothetical protein